jgi:dienelactone hydrolase
MVYPRDIQSGMMQYPSQDGTQVNGYFSRPVAAGRYPGVIVIMEAFGLVDHTKDVARRFAEQGYLALAPDMYTREGSPDPSNMDQVIKTCSPCLTRRRLPTWKGRLRISSACPTRMARPGPLGFAPGAGIP